MTLLRSYEGTNFITGLRAWAATGVVLIHSGGAGLRDLGQFGNQLADFGSVGVIIFFVISGYSVSASYLSSSDYREYFIRRFIRLSSIYYPVLFFILGMYFIFDVYPRSGYLEKFGTNVDFYNIFLHFTYLSFIDYRITNSLIGVEWTIGIEAFSYVILPFALIFLKKNKFYNVFFLLFIALFIHVFLHVFVSKVVDYPNKTIIMAWNPLYSLVCFAFGIVSYFLRQELMDRKILSIKLSNLFVVLIILFLYFYISLGTPYRTIVVSALTAILLVFCLDNSFIVKMLFSNRILIFLGTISYSMYLIHFIIISYNFVPKLHNNFYYFIFVFSLTVLISTITYYFIEKPVNEIGKKISKSHL